MTGVCYNAAVGTEVVEILCWWEEAVGTVLQDVELCHVVAADIRTRLRVLDAAQIAVDACRQHRISLDRAGGNGKCVRHHGEAVDRVGQ